MIPAKRDMIFVVVFMPLLPAPDTHMLLLAAATAFALSVALLCGSALLCFCFLRLLDLSFLLLVGFFYLA